MTFISLPVELPKPIRVNWALCTAVVLHLLLMASFFIVLTMATTRAQAAECSGSDMVEMLEREQPELMAQIRAEAALTPNGDSLFWRVDKAGAEPSWLYGTMHVADPRVLEMSPAARDAYDQAGTVVVEAKEITNLEQAMAGIMGDPSLTMLPGNEKLSDYLDKDELALLETVLEERGLPLLFVQRMKPWLVFSILSVPDCEVSRRKGNQFLDLKLATDALDQGKQLRGLESIEEQLAILSGMPIETQAALLADTAAMGSTLDDVFETMTRLYLDGDLTLFMPLIKSAAIGSEAGDDKESAYAEFEQDLIDTRNHTMAERVQPILDAGSAFVAVGALHLPGEQGLVQLLRDAGYTVTAIR